MGWIGRIGRIGRIRANSLCGFGFLLLGGLCVSRRQRGSAPGSEGDDLGEDAYGDLFGGFRADLDADGGVDAR